MSSWPDWLYRPSFFTCSVGGSRWSVVAAVYVQGCSTAMGLRKPMANIPWSTSPLFAESRWIAPGSMQKHVASLDDLLQLALGHPRQCDAVMVAEIDHRVPMCVGCEE